MGKEGGKDRSSFGEIQFVTNLYLTFDKSTFSLAECSSNIKKVLLYFHFWDIISSFDPELCICIYVAYQPAFGWPPMPIFNLLPEKMLFAFDEVKTRVGHSVQDYAVSFMRLCVMDPVLMSADDGTGPRQKC